MLEHTLNEWDKETLYMLNDTSLEKIDNKEINNVTDYENYHEQLTCGDPKIKLDIIEDPKIKLIVKPAQSGKTAIIIKLVKDKYCCEENTMIKTINFVFNANNNLLTKQTGSRFRKDCVGSETILFSSAKDAEVRSGWKELFTTIFVEDVTNIMVCNNKQRLNDIPKVIRALLKKGTYNINIWVDECDKFISSLKDFKLLVKEYSCINLWCITATPEKLFAEFGTQNVFRLDKTTSDDYHGWKDNNVKIRNKLKNTVDFVSNILQEISGTNLNTILESTNKKQNILLSLIKENCSPENIITRSTLIKNIDKLGFIGKTPAQSLSVILQQLRDKKYIEFINKGEYKLNLFKDKPYINKFKFSENTRWFIPGQIKKNSHKQIRDICKYYNFAVLIINGDGIELSIPGQESISCFPKNEELNKTIISLTEKYSLNNYPVAITGNLCISRGISIQSPEWMFTHAILSYSGSRAEVSQTAGRLNGNIKSWSSWKESLPIVYTTQEFNDIAVEVENQARELAKCAWNKDVAFNSAPISEKEFESLAPSYQPNHNSQKNKDITNRMYKIFKTKKDIEEFGKKHLHKKFSVTNKAPKTLCNDKGQNPTVSYILNRWWGVKSASRCICTNEQNWVIYWNKSSFPEAPGQTVSK